MGRAAAGSPDIYQEWLSIPPGPRPPDHYALLGVPRFEADLEAIRDAARARMKLVRPRSLKFPDLATRLMNEIAAAQVCLLDPQRAAVYRQSLGGGPLPLPIEPTIGQEVDFLFLKPDPELDQPQAAPEKYRPAEVTETYGFADTTPGRAPRTGAVPQGGWPVGLGFGLTELALAYVGKGNVVQLLTFPDGGQVVPALAAVQKATLLLGDQAQKAENLRQADQSFAVPALLGDAAFTLKAGHHKHNAEGLTSLLLDELLKRAAGSNVKCTQATASVPAYFDAPKRAALTRAAKRAGLVVTEVIDDTMAVVLACASAFTPKGDRFSTGDLKEAYGTKPMLVFDLDDEAFLTTVLGAPKNRDLPVVASVYNDVFGGRLWTEAFLELVCVAYEEQVGVDPRDDVRLRQSLRLKAWAAQSRLNKDEDTTISVTHGRGVLELELTRMAFEQATKDLLKQARAMVQEVLTDAQLAADEVGTVVLAGEASRMPAVRRMLARVFPEEVEVLRAPVLAKAHGAALKAMLGW